MAGAVRVKGLREIQTVMAHVRDAAVRGSRVRWRVGVGPEAPYGYGIHYGRRRDGRLARRAGGLHFLTRALADVRTQRPKLAASVMSGGDAVETALRALALWVEGRAKQLLTPFPYSPATRRKTGNLRRAIHARRG